MTDDVLAELRQAFAPHPDLIRRPKPEREALFAQFAAEEPGEDGFAALVRHLKGLPQRLGLHAQALDGVTLVELPPPAVFFRTTSPLLAGVVDACGSGSYARRQHAWLLVACFVDPDFEPAVDFPFYLRPRRSDWRQDEAGCRLDAWRIAFALWLYGTVRGHTTSRG
jgi:hypothetical protein